MSLPAVIRCEGETASREIAALTVLDRLVVAAHRAGCRPITILTQGPAPELKRSRQLGIATRFASEIPAMNEPVLALETGWLLQAGDLRRLVEQGGRLVAADGTPLPAGVVPANHLDAPLSSRLNGLPEVKASGVAASVANDASARTAERALWASLGSSADGMVDRFFNRPVGRLLSRCLARTRVSPNQVSVAAILMGLGSGWLFWQGTYQGALWGALLLQLSAVVDCVDGELARVLFKESPWGKWLDIVGDQVVHVGLFLGIGLGLWRAGSGAPVLALAASAAVGVVFSFLVVLRGMRQPEGSRHSSLQRLIDAATNRDFSVVLLFLVLIGRVQWFLWMTAVGVHVFWIAALAVQWWNPRPNVGWEARREKRI